MIGILDYGSGNVNAFLNVYKKLSFDVISVSSLKEMSRCSRLILPGVGAFDWVMKKIIHSGLAPHLDDFVLVKKKPILGVCVGMQIMGNHSEEGNLKGFGWIKGEVKKINVTNKNSMILPHMGWNNVDIIKKSKLFKDLNDAEFYFLHSFHFCPNDRKVTSTETVYGNKIVSSIHFKNIYATQFHPEKSHEFGEQILKNFALIS